MAVKEQRDMRSLISRQDKSEAMVRWSWLAVRGLLVAGTVATVFPLLWMMLSVLKSSREIFDIPPSLLPATWQWGNYLEAWRKLRFLLYFKNTAVIAAGTWVFAITVPALAAYSLSKLKPAGGRVAIGMFLATLMVPGMAYLIPQFLNLKHLPIVGLNLLDTYWALWLPAAVSAFNIFILKNSFDTVPLELVEAARIDGATEIHIFFRLMLPLSKPTIAVLTIFVINGVWNDFFMPFVILSTQEKLPIMVALYYFGTRSTVEMNIFLGGLAIAVIPPIVLFLVFQRHIIRGITLTGLKG
ncbi:MAG: carbohydrate ABC transporter permease [Bacteroidota bacterium]